MKWFLDSGGGDSGGGSGSAGAVLAAVVAWQCSIDRCADSTRERGRHKGGREARGRHEGEREIPPCLPI